MFLKSAVISSHPSCPGSLRVAFLHAPRYEGSDRGQTIGTLSNDDADGNENGKKTNRFD